MEGEGEGEEKRVEGSEGDETRQTVDPPTVGMLDDTWDSLCAYLPEVVRACQCFIDL